MEAAQHRDPWNIGKLVSQKRPLKPKDIWAIRIQLQNAHQVRDLAMFNLAIDSKLRGCDLVNLRVRDITQGNQVLARAMLMQKKTIRRCAIHVASGAWCGRVRSVCRRMCTIGHEPSHDRRNS